jgi:hypothetical protein
MDTSTKEQVEWGLYCENIVNIGRQYPSHPVHEHFYAVLLFSEIGLIILANDMIDFNPLVM